MKRVFYLTAICVILLFPLRTYSAEVLQITGVSSLLIGDQNRTYSVEIPCLKETSYANEEEILDLLKSELPRRSKVNLRPKGFESGKLIANIIRLEDGADIGNILVERGYIDLSC